MSGCLFPQVSHGQGLPGVHYTRKEDHLKTVDLVTSVSDTVGSETSIFTPRDPDDPVFGIVLNLEI